MLSAGAVGLIKWAMEATLIPQQGAVVSVQAVDRLPAVNCDIVAIYIDERVVEMTAGHQLWAHCTSIPTRVARKYAGNSPAYATWSSRVSDQQNDSTIVLIIRTPFSSLVSPSLSVEASSRQSCLDLRRS